MLNSNLGYKARVNIVSGEPVEKIKESQTIHVHGLLK